MTTHKLLNPARIRRFSTWLLQTLCTMIVVISFSACSSKLEVGTVQGATSQAMQVLARHPVVVKPGEQVELKGLGFKNSLALALFDAGGIAVAQTLPVAVESATTARFTVPQTSKPGIYKLNASQDGQSQMLSLVFTADMLESAIFAGDAQHVCLGQKFYDLDGNVREGSKLCEAKASSTSTSTNSDPSVVPPECSRDGEVACLATNAYRAAATQDIDKKVIAGKTVAGVDGAVKLPTNCSQDGETGCLAVTNFPAVDKINKLTPGNIKSGVTIAEVSGAYPSAQYRLAGADSIMSDLPALTYTTGGASYEWFQSDGTRLSGSILVNAQVTPGATTQTLSAGLYPFGNRDWR